ncbi:MAG TPA: hypothetical protein PK867_27105 [Pirellulales bacterium]|nr:hypothetical protein [Pirellulales bacterium]
MPKDNFHDRSDTGKPLSHCKAFLICEKVSESQITGKVTLHNLIEGFRCKVFPGRSTPFVAFLQVYDGIGRYPMRLELNDLGDGATLAALQLDDLDFPSRLTRIQLMAAVDFVPLPRPGRYELVLLVGGEPLATQHFQAEVDDGT